MMDVRLFLAMLIDARASRAEMRRRKGQNRPATLPPVVQPSRDEAGRFVSAHRLAVRAKCCKMLTDMGKEIPEVLR